MRTKKSIAGLRIDIDTLRGTRRGVPALLDVLGRYGIKATFFFSVGPDNMGRHLLRLFRPAFLVKLMRSNAPGLYGYDILLRGTLWPGPLIGRRCADIIRRTADAGHEIGLHAWDHHRWQVRIDRMKDTEAFAEIYKAKSMLEQIIDRPVQCAAAPAWRCTDSALWAGNQFRFRYTSDCRGHSIFIPEIMGRQLRQPQIPTTLPTYDELVGRQGITDRNYNHHLLSLFRPGRLNVLTIHAEVEGIRCLELFDSFLRESRERGISFCPLHNLIDHHQTASGGLIAPGRVEGREGWVSCQQAA